MVKENHYQSTTVRDKDKDLRDNYLKSFIHKSGFESVTLSNFKHHTMTLNSNMKGAPPKDKAVQKAERLKHEQNKRASEKRGLPRFDSEMAKKLLEGKFHEEDEDDDDKQMVITNDMKFLTKEEIDHQNRLD